MHAGSTMHGAIRVVDTMYLAVRGAMQHHRPSGALIRHITAMGGTIHIRGQPGPIPHRHHVVLAYRVLVSIGLVDQGGIEHRAVLCRMGMES